MTTACCALGIVALLATTAAAQIEIGSGLRVDRPVRSMKDLRDQNLVKQRFDFSCGAAALATLLRYGFGENVTERRILVELFDLLSEEEKPVARSMGFSLLHLQRVAQARGLRRTRLPAGARSTVDARRAGDRLHRAARLQALRGSTRRARRPRVSGRPVARQHPPAGIRVPATAGCRTTARGSSSSSSRRPALPRNAMPLTLVQRHEATTGNHDRPRDAGGGQLASSVARTFKV